MRRVVFGAAAVRRAGRRSTRASYKLSGRTVPDSHVRTEAVIKFLGQWGAGSRENRPSAVQEESEPQAFDE